MALHQAGQIDDAERLYRELLTHTPEHATARHYLGVCHYQRGQLPEAAIEISRALRSNPAEPMALAGTLSKMGMPLAFTAGSADFGGMSKPGEEALFISRVFHKAFVRVDEKGTEAAAATGAVVGATSAPVDPPVQFTVDRPFVFLIRHRESGAVLFAGRVTDPA